MRRPALSTLKPTGDGPPPRDRASKPSIGSRPWLGRHTSAVGSFRFGQVIVLAAAVALMFPVAGRAAKPTTFAAVKRGLEGLVAAKGGPPGAIATLYIRGRTTVLSAGRANVSRQGAPRASDHMRIASVAKAFSGAVALHLVQQGLLGLDDTIGKRLPAFPAAWASVTVRQMLNHTSGLPDYTRSEGFAKQVKTDPQGFVAPSTVIDWVRSDGAQVHARLALRVFEHRQHRDRADRRGGHRAPIRQAALPDRLPSGEAAADDVPHGGRACRTRSSTDTSSPRARSRRMSACS